MRTFNYIQRFYLKIKHKLKKQHIIFNVLFRFVNTNINFLHNRNIDGNELNILFIISLIKIKFKFKQRILNNYKNDLN